jgi:hypothetical protein
MHLPISLLAGLSQSFNEVLSIDILQENPAPPIAPAHQMAHRSAVFQPKFARHFRNLLNPHKRRQPNNALIYGLTPFLG